MGIDKAGKDDLARAVNLMNLPAILRKPGITQCLFDGAYGHDLAADAKYGGIVEDDVVPEGCAAEWAD
jgi:hypothetical protein